MARKWSEDEAAHWLNADSQREMLDLPRKIAASIVSADKGRVSKFIDIASGPGTFLKVFLDYFPDSLGIWHDASESMRNVAQKELADYSNRVSWIVGDMSGVASLDIPSDLDAVLTSRATHHFSAEELTVFYSDVARLLRPGGWIINLDHAYLGSNWDPVVRSARKQLFPGRQAKSEADHQHTRSAPGLSEHLASLASSGVKEVTTAWQTYYTFLIMAKKPSK